MSIDVHKMMADAGITKEEVDAARHIESHFASYKIGGRWVHVEIIAPNLAEVIFKHTTDKQTALISVMLNLVPEAGDHEVIIDDHGNGRKPRGARIVRMKDGEDGQVNLLLTR